MPNDGQSFEALFEAEKDRLLRMLCVITGSRAEAEDIAQEAFTRVFERWDRVGGTQAHGSRKGVEKTRTHGGLRGRRCTL